MILAIRYDAAIRADVFRADTPFFATPSRQALLPPLAGCATPAAAYYYVIFPGRAMPPPYAALLQRDATPRFSLRAMRAIIYAIARRHAV